MPAFNSSICEADDSADQYSFFRAHYASQVALRRLCLNLNNCINDLSEYAITADPTPVTHALLKSGLPTQLAHQSKEIHQTLVTSRRIC
jgi:hypothetical protein